MVIADREELEKQEEFEVVNSDNWELPVINLGTGKYAWRPYTACLPYTTFQGPAMTRRTHGLNLDKDLLIGVHGARGAAKTLTVSYLIARKMRMGQPAWTNWPISFYVVEPECWDACSYHDNGNTRMCVHCRRGKKTYYESQPLNFDKLYTFNSEISNGVVGITELQYYAESRTSNRGQNRMLSYQLMQIRKSACSFFYDVQNPRWADNRFSWSDDVKIFCRDMSKMNYDFASVGHEIQEGEYSQWTLWDISGVMTGEMHEYDNNEVTAQFYGLPFWWIYPTKWKIDIYDAVYSMKQKGEKADKQAAIGKAMELAVNSFLEESRTKITAEDMWARASSLGNMTVSPVEGGKVLSGYGIDKRQNSKGKWVYDLSPFLDTKEERI